MMLAIAFLGAVAFGRINEETLRNATVRIIRMDDLEIALKNKRQLPRSFTGVLVTDTGYIFTSLEAAHNANGKIDANVTNNRYLILFPQYNGSESRVVSVSAHLGISQIRSEENQLLGISIPRASLPQPLIVDRTNVEHSDSGNKTLKEVGYPASSYQTLATNKESLQSLLGDLAAFQLNVREDAGYAHEYGEATQATHAPLLTYMTSNVVDTTITRVTNQVVGGTIVEHTANLGTGSEGSPMVDLTTGYIKAMVFTIKDQKDIAVRSEALLNIANANKIVLPEPSSFAFLWVIIIVMVLVLLTLIIILILQKPNGGNKKADAKCYKQHTRDKAILYLRGEDGTRYSLSTRDLQHGVILGRSHSADKRFNKSTISSKHALISGMGGKAVIIDKNSKGGTYLNGKKLTPGMPEKLHDGDTLSLADYKIRISGVTE